MSTDAAMAVPLDVSLPVASLDVLVDAITDRVIERMAVREASGRDDGFVNTEQAARYLACSPQRIYDLRSAGRLPVHKEGRRSLYRRADLDALVHEPWPQRGPDSEKSCKLAA